MAPEEKTSSNGEFPRQPLLSVERQIETNIETGRSQTRMFVKMYFEARDSGLLAAIPTELWQTLCCLATYMDADGYCYPGQSRMARELGISRQQLNARLKRLVAFRFQERPVIHVKKERRSEAGQWARNVYKVLPISGLGIFGGSAATETPPKPRGAMRPVSTQLDTGSVSGRTDAAALDMNQSPKGNKITPTVCRDGGATEDSSRLVETFHRLIGRAGQRATPKELHHAAGLIASHGTKRAEFITEYAVREAKATNFRMRHFGAVCSYIEDALAALATRDLKLKRDATARERRSEEDLHARYESWRRTEVERLVRRMQPEVVTQIETGVRGAVLASYGGTEPPAFEILVRIRMAERVAAIHQLPSFESWSHSEVRSRRRISDGSSEGPSPRSEASVTGVAS